MKIWVVPRWKWRIEQQLIEAGIPLAGISIWEPEAQRLLARAHVLNYRTDHAIERVAKIADGAMLPLVYEGVGKNIFEMSVSFGNASGSPDPVDMAPLVYFENMWEVFGIHYTKLKRHREYYGQQIRKACKCRCF